jgi:preprotein translocase subunit Sss1/type II secretory pathway predicted ATPase ExeA
MPSFFLGKKKCTVTILIIAILFSSVAVQAHPFTVNNLIAFTSYPILTCSIETDKRVKVSPLQTKTASATPQKTVKRKTRRLDPFKKEQGKELLRASTQMGLGIFLIGSIGYFIGGTQALNASTFMGPLISGMLTKPLGNIGNKLCVLFTPYLANPGLRRAMDYKSRFEKRKYKLTKSMRVFLHTTISKYTNLVENWGLEVKECERAIEEVLQFPIAPKSINPELAPITQFVKNYPEEVRITVGDFTITSITDSKFERLEKKAVPLMFVGPPGTGKTYLASQIGDLLGLPVQIIDVAKYKSVNGHSFWSNNSEPGIIVDVLLGGQTKKGNFSNKILVLDEIDKALARDENGRFLHEAGPEVMSLLHTLLETQETTARLRRYESSTYDISHLKIILVGNRTFSEVLGKENATALESRVNLIKFNGFTDGQKLAIAREHIKKICLARSISYEQIDQMVVEEIIKTDTKVGNQGVRVMLKVVDQYLRILEKGALIGEVAGLPPITFDISKAYAREQVE